MSDLYSEEKLRKFLKLRPVSADVESRLAERVMSRLQSPSDHASVDRMVVPALLITIVAAAALLLVLIVVLGPTFPRFWGGIWSFLEPWLARIEIVARAASFHIRQHLPLLVALLAILGSAEITGLLILKKRSNP